jgi:hypothetical protein
MCSTYIDESAIHVSITSQLSHLYVPFFEKSGSLLDRLDNQRMMHNFQCGVFEWVHENRNDAHYCGTVMLHGL